MQQEDFILIISALDCYARASVKGSVPTRSETEHIGGTQRRLHSRVTRLMLSSLPHQFHKTSEALSCLGESTAPKAGINTEQDWAETGTIRKKNP